MDSPNGNITNFDNGSGHLNGSGDATITPRTYANVARTGLNIDGFHFFRVSNRAGHGSSQGGGDAERPKSPRKASKRTQTPPSMFNNARSLGVIIPVTPAPSPFYSWGNAYFPMHNRPLGYTDYFSGYSEYNMQPNQYYPHQTWCPLSVQQQYEMDNGTPIVVPYFPVDPSALLLQPMSSLGLEDQPYENEYEGLLQTVPSTGLPQDGQHTNNRRRKVHRTYLTTLINNPRTFNLNQPNPNLAPRTTGNQNPSECSEAEAISGSIFLRCPRQFSKCSAEVNFPKSG